MNKWGKVYNGIEERFKDTNASWTKEGWVVEGNLDLSCLNLEELPLIKSVTGYFSCSFNRLTFLHGAPDEVGGYFICTRNTKEFSKIDVTKICKVKGHIFTDLDKV